MAWIARKRCECCGPAPLNIVISGVVIDSTCWIDGGLGQSFRRQSVNVDGAFTGGDSTNPASFTVSGVGNSVLRSFTSFINCSGPDLVTTFLYNLEVTISGGNLTEIAVRAETFTGDTPPFSFTGNVYAFRWIGTASLGVPVSNQNSISQPRLHGGIGGTVTVSVP